MRNAFCGNLFREEDNYTDIVKDTFSEKIPQVSLTHKQAYGEIVETREVR